MKVNQQLPRGLQTLWERVAFGVFWTANKDSDRVWTRQKMIQLKKQQEVHQIMSQKRFLKVRVFSAYQSIHCWGRGGSSWPTTDEGRYSRPKVCKERHKCMSCRTWGKEFLVYIYEVKDYWVSWVGCKSHVTYPEQTSFQLTLVAFVEQGDHLPLYLKGNKNLINICLSYFCFSWVYSGKDSYHSREASLLTKFTSWAFPARSRKGPGRNFNHLCGWRISSTHRWWAKRAISA